MKDSKISPTHDRRLLVEGLDKWTVIELMRKHGCEWDNPPATLPYLKDTGGVKEAMEQFGILLKTTRYTRVGVIVDADADLRGRWDAISGHLKENSLPSPPSPPAEGWIGAKGARRFGVWIMPDNLASGKLEHFLSRMIPRDDPTWPWAQKAAAQARLLGAPFRDVDTIKAEMHTWLAWRESPGKPFGTALSAQYLRAEAEDAAPFVNWFRRLFLAD